MAPVVAMWLGADAARFVLPWAAACFISAMFRCWRFGMSCGEVARRAHLLLRHTTRYRPGGVVAKTSLKKSPKPGTPLQSTSKKRPKAKPVRPSLPGMPPPDPPGTTRVLPMLLRIGDRLTDETGEYEVIGRPYTTAGGKTANVRVKRVDSGAEMIRVWGTHERLAVRRV
jgi:hypothetical protein